VATGCDTRNRTRQETPRASATRKVSAGARNAAVPGRVQPHSVATKTVLGHQERLCRSGATAASRGTSADPGTSTLDGLAYTRAAPHYIWELLLLLTAGLTVGYAMLYAAMPITVTEAVPAQQGIATGMLGVAMALGTSIGPAILAALLNNHPVIAHIDIAGHQVTQHIPQIFADPGHSQGFWAVIMTTLVVLAITAAMRSGRTPATGCAEQWDRRGGQGFRLTPGGCRHATSTATADGSTTPSARCARRRPRR
jgi:MFS family permease